MLQAGILEPDMAVEAIACKSMSELKEKITKSW